MSVLESVRCTVLNATYEVLHVTSDKKALLLYIKGTAQITKEHPEFVVYTTRDIWPVPVQIVLRRKVRQRPLHVPAALTPRNLHARDDFSCQFCGRHKSEFRQSEFLTKDHLIPKDRGGKNSWMNLVSCCNSCNNRKANRSPSEAKMKLLREPYVPTTLEIMTKLHGQYM